MQEVDPETGEVIEAPMELVPLNLAALDEDRLLDMFPTPVQAAGALVQARAVAARAPRALDEYRRRLQAAERALVVATAIAVRDLSPEFPRATLTERKMLAATVDAVREAQDARDEAWLLLEYARDFDKAVGRDIDILRSLNANFRSEHTS